jgi:hypothetical protein
MGQPVTTRRTGHARFGLAVLLATTAALTSCSTEGANGGDCMARVRFDGRLYEPVRGKVPKQPETKRVGRAEIVDCGSFEDAPQVATVDVNTVGSCPPTEVVMVTGKEWRGIYAIPTTWTRDTKRPC